MQHKEVAVPCSVTECWQRCATCYVDPFPPSLCQEQALRRNQPHLLNAFLPDCPLTASSPPRTSSSEILLSPARQMPRLTVEMGLMVRRTFFPAALTETNCLQTKPGNTQEKRYEYLKSFLNTNLNTLTIQPTSLLFYRRVVKCSWTKCEPANAKGTTSTGLWENTLPPRTGAYIPIRSANSSRGPFALCLETF